MPNDYIDKNVSGDTFWKSIVIHKFSKPAVLIFVLLASLAAAFYVAHGGLISAFIVLVVIVGLPAIYATVAFPKFGIIILISVAFIINGVSRVAPDNAPIGIAMDGLTYLLILGFFIKQQKEGKALSYYFKNEISYFILGWLVYNLLEAINPIADSRLAWLYTVRTVAFLMLLYYIFVFHIRSKDYIKTLFKVWLIFDLLAAMSAFQQEKFGFFGFEQRWLAANPLEVSFLFINGHMRKFGIFSDPVVFAYNMVTGSLLCLAFIVSNIKTYKKVILIFLMGFFLMVMLYSGTRAAFALLPVALIMLAILKFNKRILISVIIAGLLLLGLINMPTSNASLYRFQSAFKPTKDASFNVRVENQRRIKPYILAHPIGGGLGSVGIWGQRFSPNSYLSKFPPDSGYVRVAVEMGWIGLILYCVLNFVILYKGIYYYYIIKDPQLKTFCLAMVLVIFAFDCGNYLQQATVQYPSNILFFLAIAILNVSMRLDLEKRQPQLNATVKI
jgi:O-antigen ligase